MPQHAAVIESASQAHREGLEMLCVDGGQGRLAALANVDPAIPVQRCPAHKITKVLNKIRQADQEAVKANLHAVVNGDVMLDKSR